VNDLHLTLAFIGDLDDGAAFDLAAAIAMLHFDPINWQINKLGFFQLAGVVWAGSDRTTPLDDLAHCARALLDRTSIAYDQRPWAPHVTLLRGVQAFETEEIAAIEWRIASLGLYRSAPSAKASRYAPVMR
jgi:2'-5' RNA ligase